MSSGASPPGQRRFGPAAPNLHAWCLILTKQTLLISFLVLVTLPAWSQQTLTLTLQTPQVSSSPSTAKADQSTPPHVRSASASETSRASGSRGQVIGRVGIVNAPSATIRASRSSGSRILAQCRQGTPLGIVNTAGQHYGILMIDGSTGWIPSKLVKLLDYNLVMVGQKAQTIGQQIVQIAMKYLGVSYSWGGYSWSGLDCSGFVKAVFANFGFDLPRCSRDQARVGSPVPFNQLQPGDRLYFACKGRDIDHTGIYAGNGYFIHSASSRGGVTFDSVSGTKYGRTLVAARR